MSVTRVHGSLPYSELRELGIKPGDVVDFSATVNPYPLPPTVIAQLTDHGLDAYPDPECHDAVESLARYVGLNSRHILMTVGVTETIFALPRLFPSAIAFGPTYGDFAAAFAREHRPFSLMPFPQSHADCRESIALLASSRPSLLVLCNPNNPDGLYVESHEIAQLCTALPYTMVCVDESYQEISDRCASAASLVQSCPNLMVLKSVSKPFGLGGIRVGYVVSSESLIDRLRSRLLPWGVSSLAQRLTRVLLAEIGSFAEQWALTLTERNRMVVRLRTEGYTVTHGRCPFFLVRVGKGAEIRRRLLQTHRLCVRDCASFGLPEWIRIMPRRPMENDLLVSRLLAELQEAQ